MNGFLLDTNTVSEVTKPRPDPKVTGLLKTIPIEQMFISVMTVGEIYKGVLPLPDGNRRASLETFLSEVETSYGDRVIRIDAITCRQWAQVVVQRSRLGRPISTNDALIAATALQHNLTLITRNTDDFTHTNVQLLNPWT
jgi:predicted nucleic acid-binding protein